MKTNPCRRLYELAQGVEKAAACYAKAKGDKPKSKALRKLIKADERFTAILRADPEAKRIYLATTAAEWGISPPHLGV